MKIKSVLTVSALALLMSSASFAAETEMNKDYNSKPAGSGYEQPEANDGPIQTDVKQGLNKADAKMRETADDIRAFFVDETKGGRMDPISIRRETTVHGMIGKDILTPEGKEIAKIEDIILDQSGNASKVIVSDGGLLGIGDKLAAFDYGRVITTNADGKVVMSLSQETIDSAAKFSYDRKDYLKADVIPSGSLSVNDLLDGQVYDTNGKKVADIDNLSISGGKAERVIVGFDKTLGMGGDLAALDFSTLKLVQEKGEVNAKLTEGQTRQFANFKQSAKK